MAFNSPQDLLDTLEDLIEVCASQQEVDTEIFTALITYEFLSEGIGSTELWRTNIAGSIVGWFHHLRAGYTNLTTSSNLIHRASDIELNKLVYYFLCCSWTCMTFLYPALAEVTSTPFPQAIEDAIQYLHRDLGGECYYKIALIYSLYGDYFPEDVLVKDFSQILSSPEVS